MIYHDFLRRSEGTAAIEFGIVGVIFVATMFAVVQGGLVVWTQVGIQHAVEAAARCAAVNSSTCGNASQIQTFAATQAYGLNLPASTFAYSLGSCGNVVSASYTYRLFTNTFSTTAIPLRAQACFPS
jgi:Flp pilus assembly protein TadG